MTGSVKRIPKCRTTTHQQTIPSPGGETPQRARSLWRQGTRKRAETRDSNIPSTRPGNQAGQRATVTWRGQRLDQRATSEYPEGKETKGGNTGAKDEERYGPKKNKNFRQGLFSGLSSCWLLRMTCSVRGTQVACTPLFTTGIDTLIPLIPLWFFGVFV